MGSRPGDFIRNLGASVSQLVDPGEREDMVRTAARAAAAGVAAEVDQLGPDLLDRLPDVLADATERATRAGVRGGVLELEAVLPELHHTLTQARIALDDYVRDHRHAVEGDQPGPRMQRMAEGAVRGAATEVRRLLPEISAELRRVGAREDWAGLEAAVELGVEMIGRRLVAGMASELSTRAAAVDAGAMIQDSARATVAGAIDGLFAGLRRSGLDRWRWPAALVGMAGLLTVGVGLVVRR